MANPDEKQRPITPADRIAARIATQAAAAAAAEAAAAVRAQARPARPIRVGLAFFGSALALCLLAYLAFAVPGPWFPRAPVLSWPAGAAALARGAGQMAGNALAITAADAADTTLISINTDIRSSDYRAVQWNVSDLPAQAEVRMLWQTEYAQSKMNSMPVSVIAGRPQLVDVAGNPNWIGPIRGIALIIQSPLAQPVYFRGVTAKPMGAVEILRDRLREWLSFERWTGVSINVVPGGANVQDLPLPPLLAVAALLAMLASWLRLRRTPRLAALPVALAAIFVVAWLAADLRWQWSLARQVIATKDQYAGKDWRGKHLAAEDGPLFAFIDNVRGKLAENPGRVFMIAEAHYFRDRGAYHLYPYNVQFDPYRDAVPPSSALRPGDYLVIYNRRGVQYDAAAQRLRFADGTTVAAELVLAERGSALLRVR